MLHYSLFRERKGRVSLEQGELQEEREEVEDSLQGWGEGSKRSWLTEAKMIDYTKSV